MQMGTSKKKKKATKQRQQPKPEPFCDYTLYTQGMRQENSHSLASVLKKNPLIKTLSFMSYYHMPFLTSHVQLSASKGS